MHPIVRAIALGVLIAGCNGKSKEPWRVQAQDPGPAFTIGDSAPEVAFPVTVTVDSPGLGGGAVEGALVVVGTLTRQEGDDPDSFTKVHSELELDTELVLPDINGQTDFTDTERTASLDETYDIFEHCTLLDSCAIEADLVFKHTRFEGNGPEVIDATWYVELYLQDADVEHEGTAITVEIGEAL